MTPSVVRANGVDFAYLEDGREIAMVDARTPPHQ
jgi:hypothetical protein